MTLRDTRIGRWARKHDRTHRLIHATWCRAVGPFDTKRVASSNGSVTGGGSTTPAYSSFVVFYSTGGGVQYKTTTQSDALAWAKANAPVGVTYSIFGINGGQHFITGGLGTQTGQAAVSQIGTVANPVPGLNAQVITGPPSVNTSANPPVQVGWRVTGVGPGVNGPQTTYDAVDYDYTSAVADAKAFQQQGLTGIVIVPWYSQ